MVEVIDLTLDDEEVTQHTQTEKMHRRGSLVNAAPSAAATFAAPGQPSVPIMNASPTLANAIENHTSSSKNNDKAAAPSLPASVTSPEPKKRKAIETSTDTNSKKNKRRTSAFTSRPGTNTRLPSPLTLPPTHFPRATWMYPSNNYQGSSASMEPGPSPKTQDFPALSFKETSGPSTAVGNTAAPMAAKASSKNDIDHDGFPAKFSSHWKRGELISFAQDLQLSFDFAGFAAQHRKTKAQMFDMFSFLVSIPIHEYVDYWDGTGLGWKPKEMAYAFEYEMKQRKERLRKLLKEVNREEKEAEREQKKVEKEAEKQRRKVSGELDREIKDLDCGR